MTVEEETKEPPGCTAVRTHKDSPWYGDCQCGAKFSAKTVEHLNQLQWAHWQARHQVRVPVTRPKKITDDCFTVSRAIDIAKEYDCECDLTVVEFVGGCEFCIGWRKLLLRIEAGIEAEAVDSYWLCLKTTEKERLLGHGLSF